jgi:hypothetical protein
MTNPLLIPLENALGYYRINKVVCEHNHHVDIDRVYSIVYETYYNQKHLFNGLSIYSLMDKFESTKKEVGSLWNTHSGKYVRRLIKAIPELDPVAGIIGDEITRKAYQKDDYNWLLSLTDEIFWDNGNFGNPSSCWWTMYPESRRVFIDANGIGLLWHSDPQDRYNGIGRTWILPIHEYTSAHGYIDGLFLFNQYGEVNGRTIRIDDTARYLNSVIPDTDAQTVRLYNDDSDYTPYINDNTGVLIKLKIYPLEKYTEFHLNIGGDDLITCYECNDEINERDALEFHHRRYCQSCYDENFATCDNCNDIDYIGDMHQQDYSIYCDSCFNDLFTYCDDCNEYYNNEDTTYINGSNYCQDCLNDNFTTCETCDELTPNDEMTEIDGCYYCNDCIPEPETI